MLRYSTTLGSTVASSSYPLSTTACKRARVTESLLANNVTSQPRATSPSVTLLATVSHAPYCRGGVRPAIGDRIATRLLGTFMLFDDTFLLHGRQHFIERNGCKTGGMIGHAIGNDQFAVVEEGATGVDHVRHVAFPLLFVRFEQRLPEAADHFARIVVIEKECTDAVRAQGPDSVAED